MHDLFSKMRALIRKIKMSLHHDMHFPLCFDDSKHIYFFQKTNTWLVKFFICFKKLLT